MQNLIDLYNLANDKEILILDNKMKEIGIEAISIKTRNCTGILLDYEQIENTAKEKCLLAHELGHCETGAMHKLTSPYDLKIKNEYIANRWAVHKIVPFNELTKAIKNGYTEPWQLSEYFNVTEDFICLTYAHYKKEGLLS